ncbi:EF-hand domain-containing protein [Actinomadura barringtoniae]|uniref:EF-hand domain-containing protein n=1 Tax=Actinomadura barringtoniae TaxID=1427535 RepID=A0A939P8Z7_9ACTN|nr:EF-hand domain-containing protein [Actinomadura barringtoniae]MBO2448020.1 EF-hand domain-containing protein [Actinomadura barringtoniae]
MRTAHAVDTLIARKLAKRFQLLDFDGDGYITGEDYDKLVDRILQIFDEPPGSERAVALRRGYQVLWRALAMTSDTDGDGRVSPEEFQNAVVGGVLNRDGGFERAILPVTKAVVALADTSGDGRLSPDEVRALGRGMGISDEEADTFFTLVDTDGDGYLTVQEVFEADRDFYLSLDPNAPGNAMFGTL